jgi:hypothetical protein
MKRHRYFLSITTFLTLLGFLLHLLQLHLLVPQYHRHRGNEGIVSFKWSTCMARSLQRQSASNSRILVK